MKITEFVIAALVGSIISCSLTLLGVWFKYYLDHLPVAQKQSLFPNPSTYPKRGNSNLMMTTINAQFTEFDFSKGNSNWLSIVYKFPQFGLFSKYEFFDFEIVPVFGNFNQIDLEIKASEQKNGKGLKTIDTISIPISPQNIGNPTKIEVPFGEYDAADIHNLKELCFVVRKDYVDDACGQVECYGKYRLQNLAVRKK